MTDGTGVAWASWMKLVDGGYKARVAQRLPGGSFGPAQDVADTTLSVSSAVNARGDLAVLYGWYDDDFEGRRFYVRMRPAGAAFLPAQPVAGTIPDDESWFVGGFAIGPDGDVLVGWRDGRWNTGGAAWVARMPAGGVFGPPQRLSAPGARAGSPGLAFDTDGRALAAWPESSTGGHSGDVRAAIAQPGLPFGGSRVIGPEASVDEWVVTKAGGDGAAVVAWQEHHTTSEEHLPDGSTERTGWSADARAVRVDLMTGTFTDAHSASRAVASWPIAAIAPDGTPAVWFVDSHTSQLRIARGNDTDGFDPPETVVCPRPYSYPRAAFFDGQGDAGVFWARFSAAHLPAYMLSRYVEADEPHPSSCPAIPPTFSVTPEIAPPGATRRLSLEGAVEPDEEGKRFSWDLDGDGEYEIQKSEDPVLEHVFEERGRHTVRWIVHLDDSSSVGSEDVIVAWPPEPALRVAPQSPQVGEAVTLDATGSRSQGGTIARYHFDFESDGSTDLESSEPVVQTAYHYPAEHQVTVTVEDDLGATATAEAIVDVQPQRSAGPGGSRPPRPPPSPPPQNAGPTALEPPRPSGATRTG
ncbi:MAG TPA: PKD domain-containing protein, partial [Solirubrobacteraceae bacterium]|nr:PKD domain-containing protein [Solirubrobacteraceae bacterium]